MADDPPSHLAHVPLPSNPGGLVSDDAPPVPIYIITEASQLPVEFLEPSPETKLVIGFDCEGVDLCRYGTLCIMQIAFPDAIYLVDAIEGGDMLIEACKPALESRYITKVIHDCKRDSEALYFQFGIKLHNVMDTQIAYTLIEEQDGRPKGPDDYISFVSLLADPRYCGISYLEKEEVRVLLRQDPKFWKYRPLSDLMIRAAADDVRFLLYIYHKMMEKLNAQSLWNLAVRGELYCRCFCINDDNLAEWPALPSIPDDLPVDTEAPEEEILSVLDVPPGKMGRVIGKKGASILAIKESCNAEILNWRIKGSPDKEARMESLKFPSLTLKVIAKGPKIEKQYKVLMQSGKEVNSFLLQILYSLNTFINVNVKLAIDIIRSFDGMLLECRYYIFKAWNPD
ncbi:piRNA biogenesis protein EXD1-like [Chenopodium quinoa]|uniref:piRNA biogenesis protein EXD1-like n=1 Tax=Chenopodium quinoa TaxID=63459 RepID=UPI000B7989D3|nr:piRNA biogenesis protein EXD1-like [Chenopodium quinoa]